MRYKAAVDGLKKDHSAREIANFFISPVQFPDMVMNVLIDRQKRGILSPRPLPPKAARPEPGFWGSFVRGRSGLPSRAGAGLLKSLATKALLLCFVLMFISCAVAPSRTGSALAAAVPRAIENAAIGPDYPLERTDGTIMAGWHALRYLFSDTPLPPQLAQSFAGMLIEGKWAGIALISPDGNLDKITAKPESVEVARKWAARHQELENENAMLREGLEMMKAAQKSNKIYIEIDLAENLLYLKMGTQTLYEFPIVTGKGYTPRESGRSRRFATPRGVRSVISKERNPVWYPPAWHWSERGLSAPASRGGIRGVLGRYRLNLGNAYGIHGTSSGSIGKPGKYSHGCIRMNHRDLEIVFKLCDVGTEVYIY